MQFQSGECSNEEWREKCLSYTPSAGGFLPTKGVGVGVGVGEGGGGGGWVEVVCRNINKTTK